MRLSQSHKQVQNRCEEVTHARGVFVFVSDSALRFGCLILLFGLVRSFLFVALIGCVNLGG